MFIYIVFLYTVVATYSRHSWVRDLVPIKSLWIRLLLIFEALSYKEFFARPKINASIFDPTFFGKIMDHVIFVKILRCRISMVKKQNRFLPPRLKMTKIDQKPLKFAYFSM